MRRLAILLFLLLPACRAGYVLKQASGQHRIASGMRPITEVVADPGTEEPVRAKLRWVQRIRAYGIDRVGLKPTENYTWFYDTGGKPVAWNVTACRKDRFRPKTWWFPIVGTVPYLGFFDLEDAKEERRDLDQDDWDTHLSEVAAYSTLGWFTDPVFSPMLRNDDGTLAATILHEMTHGTLYLTGQSEFNETLAEWVGNQAALELMTEIEGPGSPEAQRLRDAVKDEERFAMFLEGVRRQLEELYARKIPRAEKLARREEVFAQAKADFEKVLPQFHARAYAGFLKRELNNALILAYGRYHARTDLFDRAYEACGRDLRATVAFFKTFEGEKDAQKAMREWMEGAARR